MSEQSLISTNHKLSFRNKFIKIAVVFCTISNHVGGVLKSLLYIKPLFICYFSLLDNKEAAALQCYYKV